MQTVTVQEIVKSSTVVTSGKHAKSFPTLDQETRTHVDTHSAAYHLNRKAQTLRAWACLENGPIRPVRVHGRLAWPVAGIKQVLCGGA